MLNKPVYIAPSKSAEPGFYSANWLYLGKVHLKLGQADKARHWLQKAADYHPKNQEDIEVKFGLHVAIDIFITLAIVQKGGRGFTQETIVSI